MTSSFIAVLLDFFNVTIDKLIGKDELDLSEEQEDEMWQIYRQLDSVNRETLLVMGRRLFDTQESDTKISGR